MMACIQDLLLHLQSSGLGLSSLKVSLAAISAFHPSIHPSEVVVFKLHGVEVLEKVSLISTHQVKN